MSGTKIKTLYKNLKTQNETSLETFQELPINFRDMSSTAPAPLDVYLSETKATILLPSANEEIAQADYGSDLNDKDEVTGLILDKNLFNTKFAAIKAATAANVAYVSVAAPASGSSSAALAYSGSDGKSTISVSGDEIRLTSATLAGLIDNKTEVVLDGSENKVSISGSLHVNLEDHGGSPYDIFKVNAETSSGTLTPIVSVQSALLGLIPNRTTNISGDNLVIDPEDTVSITTDTTTITSNVTINAQEQVVIKLEENDAVGEIFKVETVGNNARGLITAYSEAGGEGVSTLTLNPHQLMLQGDNAVYISSFGVGADIVIGATHQVNITSEELNVEASGGISLQSTSAGHSVSIESSGLASSIDLTAGGSINLDSSSSMSLVTNGTTSDFNVTAGRGINLESNSSMSIEASGSGADVTITAADTIILSPAGNLKILGLPTNDGNSVGGPGTPGVSTWGPFLLGISSSSSYVYRSDSLGFFTGAHVYSASQNIEPGSAIVLENGAAVVSSQPNSTVCVGVAIASKQYVEGDVLSTGAIDENNAPTHLVKVAAVGDCRASGLLGFNVCNEGGDIQPGDLLVTSSTPGYLMKQADDIIRSSTVGKCMEQVTFDENGQATGVYGYVYCG